MTTNSLRVAILYHGDAEARRNLTKETRRLPKVFEAFDALGVDAEAVVYNDDFSAEIKQQLLSMQAVLTWVNPLEGGHDRTKLDAMLRDLAAAGVFVSTHPDVILKLGTKDVLVQTKGLGWGCDTEAYRSVDEMRQKLPPRLARGEVRVLKQLRGHSGLGIWRVERGLAGGELSGKSPVRVRHAKSGCSEEIITLDELFERCAPYFSALSGQGRMIDQAFQPRLPEGMVRCYLVQRNVEGFGRQEIVALHPDVPSPTKRHYHPPTMPEFRRLKQLVEDEWVPAAQRLLQIDTAELPMLWDCDFLLGPKNERGEDSYVLCEINVSCVSPFPDSAAAPLAKAVLERIKQTRRASQSAQPRGSEAAPAPS
jgi:hypothetical protein